MLNQELKLKIKSISLQTPQRECCGFVVSNGGEYHLFECANVSDNPTYHFLISSTDYIRATQSGKIIGIYHSHCLDEVCEFSEYDKVISENHKLYSILYCIKLDKFLIYEPNGYKNVYTGKDFIIGKQDCFSLVRDYYKDLHIQIKDYPRDDNWVNKTKHWYDIDFVNEGFLKVCGEFDESLAKKHDVILFRLIPNVPHASHAAIYLGNNLILHHPRNGYSLIENFNESLKRRAMMVVRHKFYAENQ